MQLVDADFGREGALLRKGSEQYWIYMRADQTPPASEPAGPPPGRTASPDGRVSARTRASSPVFGSGESYAASRQRRLDEMRQRVKASRELTPDDLEQRLQEYQMHLIRSGKTPLPIPLSAEADRKLVEEGVLPPAEAAAQE